MEERQVYISFENKDYKVNKTSLLMCKAEIIQLQKRLTTLHAIRANKRRLLATLMNMASSAEFIVSRLDDKMPEPAVSKHMQKKFNKRTEKIKVPLAKKEPKIKEEEFDVTNLDKELLELNRRIKELG